MRVTGERKTTYRLLDTPVRQGYDGVVYRVDGGTMGGMQTFVKLYPSAMRTDQERNKVIDAVNGRGGIMGPRPIEPVYERGKFAGYAFQEESAIPMPPPPPAGFLAPAEKMWYHSRTKTMMPRFGTICSLHCGRSRG